MVGGGGSKEVGEVRHQGMESRHTVGVKVTWLVGNLQLTSLSLWVQWYFIVSMRVYH